jgi:hypothetical protein
LERPSFGEDQKREKESHLMEQMEEGVKAAFKRTKIEG